MPLRELLKKKERTDSQNTRATDATGRDQYVVPPEIKIVRTDTNTEELIVPPSFPDDPTYKSSGSSTLAQPPSPASRTRHRFSLSRRNSNDPPERVHRSLSQRLHLKKEPSTSDHVPTDLPQIDGVYSEQNGDRDEKEAVWEQRATLLASANKSTSPSPSNRRVSSGSRVDGVTKSTSQLSLEDNGLEKSVSSLSDQESDVNIQKAVALHEQGKLEEATRMFQILASRGNVLSQVLYGLSLRHGWGCPKDEAAAFTYLSSAASNSAMLEQQALDAGMKTGGAVKGELVLAIFELGNCFRYGWGTSVDKVAARQYYETAANLGDVDGMEEAAWCYLEGFGGKKDKVGFSRFPLFLSPSLCVPSLHRNQVGE